MRSRAPWMVTAVFLAGWLTNLWFSYRSGVLAGVSWDSIAVGVALLAFAVLGSVIITREPRNALGWVFGAIGIVGGLFPLPEAYATYVLVSTGEVTTAVVFGAWWNSWYWGLVLGLVFVAVPMLYPNGRFLTRRWRLFALIPAMAVLGLVVLGALQHELRLQEHEALLGMGVQDVVYENPVGIEGLGGPEGSAIGGVIFGGLVLGILGGIASFGLRFRRSRGEERLQMKWFAFVAAVMPLMVLTEDVPIVGDVVGFIAWLGFPVAIGIAILKYRLYDIDVVISRSLVFGGLAGFITAIYVGIVVGVGSLLGAGGEPNLALSIVATAVVAVAFQPVRERLTRLANRVVFGKRATPYEVLSGFAGDLAQAANPERTLERMAKLVADGTGAERVFVWLRVGETMRPTAVWPEVFLLEPIPDRELGDPTVFADFDHIEEVIHDGELLGAITLTEPRGEALNHTEHELLSNLAGQAALLLRNLRLTGELRARIADLHASRRRLVQAQDDERRRLERDLHDGSQQQLAHLTRAARRANESAEREGATQAASLLAQIADDGEEAIRTVQELAHGIYPPLLATEGLSAALDTRTARAAVPVTIDAAGLGRYDREIEAAVYFCVLEAINNAAKYAEPNNVTVTLTDTDGQLVFEVTDDGTGFDPDTAARGQGLTNMTDRLDALGGELALRSSAGHGTTARGSLPVLTQVQA